MLGSIVSTMALPAALAAVNAAAPTSSPFMPIARLPGWDVSCTEDEKPSCRIVSAAGYAPAEITTSKGIVTVSYPPTCENRGKWISAAFDARGRESALFRNAILTPLVTHFRDCTSRDLMRVSAAVDLAMVLVRASY